MLNMVKTSCKGTKKNTNAINFAQHLCILCNFSSVSFCLIFYFFVILHFETFCIANIYMSKKSIVFIMNPISGTISKASIPERIAKYLDHEKFTYDIRKTEYAGHACVLAAEAKEQGVDIVVAVGGDGTVNEVARSIVHSDSALGIIPCGSGNGLARHLLLPMSVKKSIEIINACEIHKLDYGTINEYPFFCTCGMGFDAFISQKFAESGKRGPISYAENILKMGLNYEPETYEVIDENGVVEYNAFLISCANASQYGNNAYIAPQASMSDGLLDVIIMEPFDMLEASRIGLEIFNKTIDTNSKIKTLKCRNLHVRRKKSGVIHYDGDPVMAGKDLHIQIHERGINIVVNPNGDKNVRKPNLFQTATARLMDEIAALRHDLQNQGKQIQALLNNK